MLKKLFELKNHAGFIRYFNNSLWMMSEQILRVIAALLVGIWIARYLGPEQYGVFSFVVAFVALFTSIAKLGLDGILVRELISHPTAQNILISTAFWMKLTGAFLAITIISIILYLASLDDKTTLYILIIATGLIFQSFEVVDFYFQSQVLSKFVSICKNIQLIVSSLVKIYLLIINAELVLFVFVILLDQLMLAISLSIAYRCHKSHFLKLNQFSLSLGLKLLKDSWPLIISTMMIMIYMRIDQIMIEEMLGNYEVGIYSAAIRLSEFFCFIPMILSKSLFPAILSAKIFNETLYYRRLQNLYTLLAWVAISISIVMTLFSDWFVTSFFGPAYQEAAPVLAINIWASVFVFLGVASNKWFIAENLQKLALLRVVYGAIINITLNYFLISKYGIIGAAISTVLAQMVATYISDIFNKKTFASFCLKTKALFPIYRFF